LFARPGNSYDLLNAGIIRLEFGVICRPVRGDPEAAFHAHGLGMETMGLAGKMQGAAAHPADVMKLAHQSPAAFDVAA
jgi:hypothetical protein